MLVLLIIVCLLLFNVDTIGTTVLMCPAHKRGVLISGPVDYLNLNGLPEWYVVFLLNFTNT